MGNPPFTSLGPWQLQLVPGIWTRMAQAVWAFQSCAGLVEGAVVVGRWDWLARWGSVGFGWLFSAMGWVGKDGTLYLFLSNWTDFFLIRGSRSSISYANMCVLKWSTCMELDTDAIMCILSNMFLFTHARINTPAQYVLHKSETETEIQTRQYKMTGTMNSYVCSWY